MRFEKVSLGRYLEDIEGDTYNSTIAPFLIKESIDSKGIKFEGKFNALKEMTSEQIYDDIRLPTRATKGSAGYDIYAPYDFSLSPGESIKIATGIRVLLDEDKVLFCMPRSGHGFKARVQLDNTIGVIDSDYAYSDNEGHIHLKFTNDSRTGKSIKVSKGEGMAQAIILKYYTVENDDTTEIRNGGFGSTTK